MSSKLVDIERNRSSKFWSMAMTSTRSSSINQNWYDIDFIFHIWQQNAWSKVPDIGFPENEPIYNLYSSVEGSQR